MTRLVLAGGTVVTGDGSTVVEGGAVVVSDGRIDGIEPCWRSDLGSEAVVVDTAGCLVMPGLINCHTHGVAPGPIFPSAGLPPSEAEWRGSLDRHLLAGTTTVLSLCGFIPMEAIRRADQSHPVNVKATTAHLPSALLAARKCDGAGLPPNVGQISVEAMLADGAVAIGEIGAGTTLGGGGQDSLQIPAAIFARTGRQVDPEHARRIKEAALGRQIESGRYDEEAMRRALLSAGVADVLPPKEAARLIAESVLPSVRPARAAFEEAAALSAQLDVPAFLHVATASADATLDAARRHAPQGARLIACHCNHSSFTTEESLVVSTELDALGAAIELSVVDMLRGQRLVRSRETWDALLQEPDLVDVLATDWGFHGVHDSLMETVGDVVTRGQRSLAQAVAMASSNVAATVPGLAPNRGLLAPGRIADIAAVAADDFSDVRHVLVDGNHVVADGALARSGAADAA